MQVVSASRKILEEAMSLPSEERARVAAVLIASLEEGEDADAEEQWAVEIEHRARRVKAGQSRGASWEDVRERLMAQLRRG